MAKTGDMLLGGRVRGSKIVYGGMRRYLPRSHPYRRNRSFNGAVETQGAPPIMTGLDVIRHAAWRQSYLNLGGRENGKEDPVHYSGVKHLSEFYEHLPYLQVRHMDTTFFGKIDHLCTFSNIRDAFLLLFVGYVNVVLCFPLPYMVSLQLSWTTTSRLEAYSTKC